MQLKHFIEQK